LDREPTVFPHSFRNDLIDWSSMHRALRFVVLCLCWIGASAGCGDSQPPPPTVDQSAQAKVDAIKRLADSMAKDANGMDARAALEDFRNYTLDVGKNAKEGQEIVEVYQQRIKGKFQGEVAQEAQMEVAPIERALKAK
jgi:hypothetical protein